MKETCEAVAEADRDWTVADCDAVLSKAPSTESVRTSSCGGPSNCTRASTSRFSAPNRTGAALVGAASEMASAAQAAAGKSWRRCILILLPVRLGGQAEVYQSQAKRWNIQRVRDRPINALNVIGRTGLVACLLARGDST